MSEAEIPKKNRVAVLGISVLVLLVVGMGLFVELGNRSVTICKKTVPLATAIALESAVYNIYTEYGRIPAVGNRVTTNSPAGIKLLNILLGMDDKSDDALNSRGIKFLSVKTGKNNKSGLIYTADEKTVTGLFDPWGSPYTVILDTDNDEKLDFDLGGKPIKLEGRRVTVFSPGPDLKPGTSDDVTTWD